MYVQVMKVSHSVTFFVLCFAAFFALSVIVRKAQTEGNESGEAV